MNDKIIALLVEGPTEIAFYKAVVQYAHNVMGTRFECSFEWIDMHGIGNYKKDALRKFKNIQNKHPTEDISVILCIDTDVFELTKKPPIDKIAVKEALLSAGAKSVHYVEAQHSIEDWFLNDFDGVISYLGLPKNTRRPAGQGQNVLKSLFRSAKKIYVKGGSTEGFINQLDVSKIVTTNCKAIKPLCKLAKFDCKKVCPKSGHRTH